MHPRAERGRPLKADRSSYQQQEEEDGEAEELFGCR